MFAGAPDALLTTLETQRDYRRIAEAHAHNERLLRLEAEAKCAERIEELRGRITKAHARSRDILRESETRREDALNCLGQMRHCLERETAWRVEISEVLKIHSDASKRTIRTLEQDNAKQSRTIRDIGLTNRTLMDDKDNLQDLVDDLREELRLIKLQSAVAAGSSKHFDFADRAKPAASATEASGSPTFGGQAQPPAPGIKGDGEVDTSSEVKSISGDAPSTLRVDDAVTLDALAAAVRLETGASTPKLRLLSKRPASAYLGASSSSSGPPPSKKVKGAPASGAPRKGS